jgi:hypothetical protein
MFKVFFANQKSADFFDCGRKKEIKSPSLEKLF